MISIKVEGLKDVTRALSPAKANAAIRMALNETAARVKTETDRDMRSTYNIRKKDLSAWLSVSKKATNKSLVAEVSVKGSPIPLTFFSPKKITREVATNSRGRLVLRKTGRSQGVTVEIIKGRRSLLYHAFLANYGGRTQVAQRKGKSRTPTAEKKTITAASMFGGRKIMPKIEALVNRVLPERITHHINRLLGNGSSLN